LGIQNLALGDPTIALSLVFRARCREHYHSSAFDLLFPDCAQAEPRKHRSHHQVVNTLRAITRSNRLVLQEIARIEIDAVTVWLVARRLAASHFSTARRSSSGHRVLKVRMSTRGSNPAHGHAERKSAATQSAEAAVAELRRALEVR